MNNRKIFSANSVTFNADGYIVSVFAIVKAVDKEDALVKLRQKFLEQSPDSWIIGDELVNTHDGIIWSDTKIEKPVKF